MASSTTANPVTGASTERWFVATTSGASSEARSTWVTRGQTAGTPGGVHPVDAVTVEKRRGEVGSRSGFPGQARRTEHPGPTPPDRQIRFDRQTADDDEVLGDGGGGDAVAFDILEDPPALPRSGVEALDPSRSAHHDLVAGRRQHRGAPGDPWFAVGLPQVLPRGRVHCEQVRIGPAGQHHHRGAVGEQHRVPDAVVAAHRPVLGAQLPVPDGLSIVRQGDEVAAGKEGVQPFGIHRRGRGALRHVVVPFEFFGSLERPAPAFGAVLESEGGDVDRLLHRTFDRGEEHRAVPDHRAGLTEASGCRAPGDAVIGPGQRQPGGPAHVDVHSAPEAGPASGTSGRVHVAAVVGGCGAGYRERQCDGEGAAARLRKDESHGIPDGTMKSSVTFSIGDEMFGMAGCCMRITRRRRDGYG